VEEETHALPDGSSLADLLESVLAIDRPVPPAGTPPLARVIARSSFLRNELAVRDRSASLGSDDVVDVLPPFAGG
jgi:molybdopterin converting factor small subunit